ncbi:hypothetical protein AXYL_03824 [Achromobacter xylosoxidans A8]|uniref:Uncharacterized protein n=1 Tax=Achromobacter xylosoxidans (strain A8) TaxID=762376 RepID=E3HPY6_ACHXA|nr:hypothetical protein [Achromobacter xylosoxidans]ADP17144.1 hypothetical protein AXYL_03824 [Achromobacter xylosoxidans A8]
MHKNLESDSPIAQGKKRISSLLLAAGLAFAAATPVMAVPPIKAHQGAPDSAPAAAPAAGAPSGSAQKTDIQNQAAYERLMNNSGITLQWLWSAQRGKLTATDENDLVRLEGTQANHEGTLKIKGDVVSIASDRFIFRGTILILDAPDKGRRCERNGEFEFRATGKRKYWRLQQMEACGGLTDYVDVYY